MSYLELLPAVDIAGGQAVQLVQGVAGSEKRFGDPVEAQGAYWLVWPQTRARDPASPRQTQRRWRQPQRTKLDLPHAGEAPLTEQRDGTEFEREHQPRGADPSGGDI